MLILAPANKRMTNQRQITTGGPPSSHMSKTTHVLAYPRWFSHPKHPSALGTVSLLARTTIESPQSATETESYPITGQKHATETVPTTRTPSKPVGCP